MSNKKFNLKTFTKDCSGATSMEYAMLAAGIVIVVVGIYFTLGEDLKTLIQEKLQKPAQQTTVINNSAATNSQPATEVTPQPIEEQPSK